MSSTQARFRRQMSQLRPLLPAKARPVAYVGADRSNAGDAAMYLAHQRAFPDVALYEPSGGSRNRMLRLAALTRRYPAAVLLGGGTLIGRPAYRKRLEAISAVLGSLPSYMLSVGVEDPEFVAGRERTDLVELQRWVPTLHGFDAIAVRGPRSQEILHKVDIESEVVGDPALLLADKEPCVDIQDKLLGFNLGVSGDLWGQDNLAVLDSIVDLGRIMVRRGWHIRIIPVWPPDLEFASQAAARIGTNVEVFTQIHNLTAMMAAIRNCHVFVGEKLHSVVLSSAVFVPSIMLEYRPKCRDFQRSIGREAYIVRTDVLKTQVLIDMVDELASRRDLHCEALVDSVHSLRRKLLGRAERIGVQLSQHADGHA